APAVNLVRNQNRRCTGQRFYHGDPKILLLRRQNDSICGTQCAPFEIAAEHSAKRGWSSRTSCELFQLQKIFLVCAPPSQKQMDRGLRVDLVSGEAAGNGTRGRVRSPDLRERID